MPDDVKPELPEMTVKPVMNGYIITTGTFDFISGRRIDEAIYVARSKAELCRVLTHIAVRDKLA